jgi:hypothetical protein
MSVLQIQQLSREYLTAALASVLSWADAKGKRKGRMNVETRIVTRVEEETINMRRKF